MNAEHEMGAMHTVVISNGNSTKDDQLEQFFKQLDPNNLGYTAYYPGPSQNS